MSCEGLSGQEVTHCADESRSFGHALEKLDNVDCDGYTPSDIPEPSIARTDVRCWTFVAAALTMVNPPQMTLLEECAH